MYKMIAGHRRLTAYKINNHDEIPSIIKSKDISDFDARDINAVENLQRKELNLLQECNAIRHYWMAAWNREETAERVGKSPGWVQIRYMLLEMPEEIQEAAGQGYINTTDVRELNKYKNPTEQLRLAGIIRDKRKAGVDKNVTDTIRKKDKANAKKHRGRAQIFEMIEHVQNACANVDGEALIEVQQINTVGGNNLGTACLAWCAGEITTLEFHERLKDYCEQLGVFYEMPEFESELV
jgi:ParB-like chromosome segregation protein Spo0J